MEADWIEQIKCRRMKRKEMNTPERQGRERCSSAGLWARPGSVIQNVFPPKKSHSAAGSRYRNRNDLHIPTAALMRPHNAFISHVGETLERGPAIPHGANRLKRP